MNQHTHQPEWERRTEDRYPYQRPCKVFDPRSEKYWSGMTSDVSTNGALVMVDRLLEVRPGDRLFLGVAVTRREPVLRSGEMLEAEVLRSVFTVDDKTAVGVRFLSNNSIPFDPMQQRAA